MQDGVLKVDLPMSLLPSLVQHPLQVLMNEKDIAQICHVPAEYMLVGQTALKKRESLVPLDVVVDKPEDLKPQKNKKNTKKVEKKEIGRASCRERV